MAKIFQKFIFDEVGARVSIADMIGVAVCLDDLRVDKIYVSEIAVGSGMVNCAHGKIPVPAPAASLLLRGYPINSDPSEPYELTTPTGAAILRGMKAIPGMPKGFTYSKVGHGLGKKEIGRPNFLRAFFLTENNQHKKEDQIVKIETNIDNATGELLGHAITQVMAAGALDACLVPILMKKGRPGNMLSVIAPPDLAQKIEETIFRELPTLGIRKQKLDRTILDREPEKVQLHEGAVVAGKRIVEQDGTIRDVPEFDELKRVSAETNIPVRKLKV